MSQARRVSSRNSNMSAREKISSARDKNRSNSNIMKPNTIEPRRDDFAVVRSSTTGKKAQPSLNQMGSQGMKVLGQDVEMTAEELYEQNRWSVADRSTPLSNRSKTGSRPASNMSQRTPTPSKQVSLQAVKRKEEKEYPLETIDWNDFNEPVDLPNERIPAVLSSDSDSDDLSPLNLQPSAAEQQAIVDQRARDMASALSTHRPDKEEINIVKKLEVIEQEREEREQREKQEAEKLLREIERLDIGEDEEQKYTNDHYRNLSHRDVRNSIDTSFILESRGKTSVKPETSRKEENMPFGGQSEVRKGENVIGRHPMDRKQETAIESEENQMKQDVKSDSASNNAVAEAEDKGSSSDDDSDDDDDENDLIGHKGKAPNHLLMEFLSCLMEEDYENAEKLCKMILIYEPENPEALNFLPVIQQKRVQEAEEEEEESSDSEEESDDSGADDDSDEDDDDDDDDDDEEEADSSEEEDEEDQTRHPDSGIASANSD